MPIDGPEQRTGWDDWRDKAACLGWPPDLWFPPDTYSGKHRKHQPGKAEAICSTCPVRRECLLVAKRTGSTEGIWAGTTPRQRINAR